MRIWGERDHDPALAGAGGSAGSFTYPPLAGDYTESHAGVWGGGVTQTPLTAAGRLVGSGPRISVSRTVALGLGSLPASLRGRLAERPVARGGGSPPPLPKTFKEYVPRFVPVDIQYLPQMPDEAEHQYLFAAIDWASRWIDFEIQPDKTAATAARFLERLCAKALFRICTLLSDNGKEFTDRFCATGEREPTGRHRFDQACTGHGIDHRLIKPRHPQTNGMIERFNGRIAEVLKTTNFSSAHHLETTLFQYFHLYNHYLPQKNLDHVTPIAKLKDYYRMNPELFQKKPTNHQGPNTYPKKLALVVSSRCKHCLT